MVHLLSPRFCRAFLGLALGLAGSLALRAQRLDPTMKLATSAEVYSLARQADGKVVVGGNFTVLGGLSRTKIGRINADGTVDADFAPIVNIAVMCLALQSDGRILIGGQFSLVGGKSHGRIARLNADGSVDATFTASTGSASDYIKSIVVQPDGKIILAGNFTSVNGSARTYVARLNSDSTLDATFNPTLAIPQSPLPILASAAAVQPDGRIVIGGNFTSANGEIHRGIVRFLATGELDTAFAAGINGSPYTIAVQPDGKLVVGGGFSEVNGQARYYLVRLNSTGTLDANFNPRGLTSVVESVALYANGNVLAGGVISSEASSPLHAGVALFDGNSGEPSTSFALAVAGTLGLSSPGVYAVSLGSAEDIVIGGAFSSAMDASRVGLARTLPTVPVIAVQSVSRAANLGELTTFTIGAIADSTPAYQWQRDGVAIPAATATDLTFFSVQPGNAGVYTATVLAQTMITSPPTVLGVTTSAKVAGAGTEVGTNIQHPNGNIYDQVKLEGGAVSVNADPGQILRLSFLDLNGDIVQVEFSGAGTLTVTLDASTGLVPADNYLQPGVNYMKGHAGIVIAGANETTNLSIFSVGRLTAANQGIFRTDIAYDGVADLAYVAILSPTGKFGGLRAANASFFAMRGLTGVYAPGVQFTGPVYLNDISASGTAKPKLVLGGATDVRITGGDLLQANDESVQVAGISSLRFTSGSTSHGSLIAAKANRGRLLENEIDITTRIVVNP